MAVLRRALRQLPRGTLAPGKNSAGDREGSVISAERRHRRWPEDGGKLTMQANPIRQIGSRAELSPEQRRRAVTRGLDKIFHRALREDIRLGSLA
jgi:hypothetical protein